MALSTKREPRLSQAQQLKSDGLLSSFGFLGELITFLAPHFTLLQSKDFLKAQTPIPKGLQGAGSLPKELTGLFPIPSPLPIVGFEAE